MYTLVVVDMQYEFKAALDSNVQNHCSNAITKAVLDRASVVYLEYIDQGETLKCLSSITRFYDRAHYITKIDWDGADEALQVVKQFKLASKRFKICGVYSECCVHDTVRGLTQLAPTAKIEVIKDACWSTNIKDHTRGIEKMSKFKNVKVV